MFEIKKHHIENKKFGLLLLQSILLDNNCSWKTKWVCQCVVCEISYSNLFLDILLWMFKKARNRTCVEGTVIECLTSKLPKNNVQVKGVYRSKEKWIAYITLKKRYYLGSYDSIKSAAQVRKDVENKLFPTFD